MYSPKIKEELVKKLYKLKHSAAEKTPMTQMVNEAVEDYLERRNTIGEENNNQSNKNSGGNPERIEESIGSKK